MKTCYTFLINFEEKLQGNANHPITPITGWTRNHLHQVAEQELHVRVTSNRLSSRCPLCSAPSSAIHSYYRRRPIELPCVGKTVRLLLSVKKFFCGQASCPRKIFTQRLSDLIAHPSSPPTVLRSIVQ